MAKLSPSPDWSRSRVLVLVAIGCWIGVCAVLSRQYWNAIPIHDTDDATRLIMVRGLLAGRGWYDQAILRFNPPQGVWMHWSRLLDGGIAAMILAVRQVAAPAAAEYWTRFTWPLLWILPAIVAALAIGRNLGGRSAVFLTAASLLFQPQLFRQFVPGRIDHHDIQIVMTVIAMACATARVDRARWAVLAGAAAGLGLAIGLEALAVQGLIGASYGLALIGDRKAAKPAIAYGLALAGSASALFAIATPPWRWGMSFCDVMAVNLVAALTAAGLGMALVAALSSRLPVWGRAALLVGVAVTAAGVYLMLGPQCIHGPFAAMDPAVRPIWFDHIQEVQPLNRMMRLARPAAIVAAFALVMSTLAALYLLARQGRAWDPSTVLIAAAVIISVITAWFAWRMQDYVFWLGVPAVGAAASFLAARRLGDLMVPSFLSLFVLAPTVDGVILEGGLKAVAHPAPRLIDSGPKCFAQRAYRPLAALPPGLVLAPQDLGPFIVAFTHHSVVAAPYHRMSAQILAVHDFWNADPAHAEAKLRALHPDYVVDCPPYPLASGPKSFAAALRHGVTPPWLRRLTPPNFALQIYRVAPPAT
ncbi:MAG TPA: hypothetical protein VGH15_11100 [Caulobacteraceae bacterium]